MTCLIAQLYEGILYNYKKNVAPEGREEYNIGDLEFNLRPVLVSSSCELLID